MEMEMEMKKPEINVGMIGQVAQGKSKTTEALSGLSTIKFKQEKERNITIKLGYANTKIYKNKETGEYYSNAVDKPLTGEWTLKRHISFVDTPGHDSFMSTMISGASVMDAVILIVAANEPCPQPQTKEHLMAIEVIAGSIDKRNIIIVQNKLDLVSRDEAMVNYDQIKQFVKGTIAERAPIVPVCAVLGYNINKISKYIAERFVTPKNLIKETPRLSIIRSFDINKPGIKINKMKGGVLGGTVLNGSFKIGDPVVIKPGLVMKDSKGNYRCVPVKTVINSLYTEKIELQEADKGGLIGIGTNIDPCLTAKDRIVGAIVELATESTEPNEWKIYSKITVKYGSFKRVAGTSDNEKTSKNKVNDTLVLNIGSNLVDGKILEITHDTKTMIIRLKNPIYSKKGKIIAISKIINGKRRLVGYGKIISKDIRKNSKSDLKIFKNHKNPLDHKDLGDI